MSRLYAIPWGSAEVLFGKSRNTAAAKESRSNCCPIRNPICYPAGPFCHLTSFLHSLKWNMMFYSHQETWLHKVQMSLAFYLPCPPHVSTFNIHSTDCFLSSLLTYLCYSQIGSSSSFSLQGVFCVYLLLPDRYRFLRNRLVPWA